MCRRTPTRSVAGFVLAGGASSRMGRDKALLPFAGRTLVEHIAGMVQAAAESATVVGAPERYQHLGLPTVPDRVPGSGPLGGVITALECSPAEWSLVVACDLPRLSPELLDGLIETALGSEADCVPAESSSGIEPLCAVWNRTSLPHLRCALEAGRRKMKEAIAGLRTRTWRVHDNTVFHNVNTPADWDF